MSGPIVIAIDGPVAAGKGTLARRLAEHLGLCHLDSGMIYRATAARLLEGGGGPGDVADAEQAARDLTPDDLQKSNLREQAIGQAASQVAALQTVRDALLDFQRNFAVRMPGTVIDGRDIGTVVCPDADVKLYVTAGLEQRARRRHDELLTRGGQPDLDDIRTEIAERDRRDSEREVSPLRQAGDAVLIDTSNLDANGAFRLALEIVHRRLNAADNTSIQSRVWLEGRLAETAAPASVSLRNRNEIPNGRGEEVKKLPENSGDNMIDISVVQDASASDESFEDLFNEFIERVDIIEGAVVNGKIVSVQGDAVLIDVGLKAEGRVALREFAPLGGKAAVDVGDEVEIFVERLENRNGEIVLSREKAQREEVWNQLEKAFETNDRVKGYIVQRVKGGFTVNMNGALAFLPGSQVDIRPVRDVTPLMGDEHEFRILKMDRRRGNIVVSRRSVLEDERADQRADLIAGLTEGKVLDGVVKNITDYGAFVDLGGLDGLLHVTDISWRRINHPTEALSIGQTVRVQVIRFNPETQRISLGMKQLEADPWEGVGAKYPVSARFKGRVTNITDYGAFVELEPGIEGLVHVSEMSWTRKNVHPGKIVSTSQEVDVEVLDVDADKRRISLGIKQTQENPWDIFIGQHPVDSQVEGEIKNITEFGLFIDLGNDLDGMVHMSDLSWDKSGEEAILDYKKGDQVKAKVLDVDIEKERISLGVKQLEADPLAGAMDGVQRGAVVTCKVTKIMDNGIEVLVDDTLPGFIRKAELARERGDQRPDRFAEGDRLDAKVTAIDKGTRRLSLSVKALEIEEEKKAMKTYGSADSGATLGDILGAALSAKGTDDETADEFEDETDGAAEEAASEAESDDDAAGEDKEKKS